MKRRCCIAEQVKGQTVKGEEEGDSDEMILKGNEGAEGEAGGKLRKKKQNPTKKEEKWFLPGEIALNKVMVASMSLTPLSSLESLSRLRCATSGGC